jgi:hypothetical protein
MRQRQPPRAALPPFTRAEQRQLAALLAQLQAGPSDAPSRATFERLLAALPGLQSRLPDDQQRLIAELDRSDEALEAALGQLHAQLSAAQSWAAAFPSCPEALEQLEDQAARLAQYATEAALRAGQRRELLMAG